MRPPCKLQYRVVPAKAGTHSHRRSSGRKTATAAQNDWARRRDERNCAHAGVLAFARTTQVICPTGSLLIRVSSPLCKNILLRHLIETDLLIPPSHPTEGRIMIVTNAGRDAVDAAAFCARGDGRAGDEPVSDQQHADERCCCGRRSRVVLTPRRWRQVRGGKSALPGLDTPYPLMTVANKPDHRGARSKPLKPLRAGTPGDSGVLVVTRVRSTTTKCTRGRGCNGHPAFPTPSMGGKYEHGPGASRRGDAKLRLMMMSAPHAGHADL